MTIKASSATDKLISALKARPGSTSFELHQAAGIGRSTAGKILAKLASNGQVTRQSSPDKTLPDRWHLTDSTEPFESMDPNADIGPKTTDPAGRLRTAMRDRPGATTNQLAESAGINIDDIHELLITLAQADEIITIQAPGQKCKHWLSADRQKLVIESQPVIVDGTEQLALVPTDPTSSSSPGTEADGDDVPLGGEQPGMSTRLAPNGLRRLIEGHLRDHPDTDHSPYQIGRHLHRSPGAVLNALERLVAAGVASRTNESPRRYRWATTTGH